MNRRNFITAKKAIAAITIASFLISLVIAPDALALRVPEAAEQASGSAAGFKQALGTTSNAIGDYENLLRETELLAPKEVKGLVREWGLTLGQLAKVERGVNRDPEELLSLTFDMPAIVVMLAGGGGTRVKLPETDINYGRPKVQLLLDLGGGRKRTISELLFEQIEKAGMEPVVVLPGRPDFRADVLNTCAGKAAVTQQYPLGTGHAAMQAERALRDYNGIAVIIYSDMPLITADMLKDLADKCQNAKDANVVASMLVGTLDDPLNPVNYGKVIVDSKTGDCLTIIEQREIDKMIIGAGGQVIKDNMGKVMQRIYPQNATVENRGAIQLPSGRIITAEEADKSPYWNSGIYAARSPQVWDLLGGIDSDNSASEFYLTELVTMASKAGKVVNTSVCDVEASKYLAGINYAEQITRCSEILRERAIQEAASRKTALLIAESEDAMASAMAMLNKMKFKKIITATSQQEIDRIFNSGETIDLVINKAQEGMFKVPQLLPASLYLPNLPDEELLTRIEEWL